MTTKQEIEDRLRARIRPGMSREEIRSVTESTLREVLPTVTVDVADAATDTDREQGRMRATVHVGNVPADVAADLLADVPGTRIRIAGSVELARYEPSGSLLVTICSVCRRASCWHGVDLCDEAKGAATVDLPRSELAALKLEHADNFSDAKLRAVGNVEDPPACEICGEGFDPGALVVDGYGEPPGMVHADCYLTHERAGLEDAARGATT